MPAFAARAPIGSLLVLLLGLLAGSPEIVRAQSDQTQEFTRLDPARVVTAEPCGECHASEYRTWKESKHYTGFKTLHRRESAERISKAMGFDLIKRESLCLKCHYTPIVKGGQLRAVSGVSCEDCHGAARDWINIHNDHGPGADYKSETPEHRAERIRKSKEAGMLRPSELYDVVSNCFQCHTVPHEDLVNTGGHSSGSNFELVSWLEKIRHNFLKSFLAGGGTQIEQPSDAKKRVMYVVGRMLDLEHSVRGIAVARQEGRYLKAMERRARNARAELKAIRDLAPIPQVNEILAAAESVGAQPNRGPQFTKTAERIASLARAFIEKNDGNALEALDPLLAGEPVVARAEEGATAPPEGGAEAAEGGGSAGGGGASSSSVVGELKRRIHPVSSHRTVGPGCNCHAEQESWWSNDAHYSSADRFFDQSPRAVQIARNYGISASDMLKGNQVCMDCHGTVVTGKESRDAQDGVSCESCHGPAGDYLEPHREGDKSLGDARPGYVKALQLGMVKLKDVNTRAERCARCHYITEPRLISAGHTSGKGYDFAGGNQRIKHWKSPLAPAGQLQSAFQAVVQKRGGVPDVPVVAVSSVAAPPGGSPASSGGSRSGSRSSSRGSVQPVTVNRRSAAPVALPPFPQIDDDTPVDEMFLILKQRLELLHEKTGGGS